MTDDGFDYNGQTPTATPPPNPGIPVVHPDAYKPLSKMIQRMMPRRMGKRSAGKVSRATVKVSHKKFF